MNSELISQLDKSSMIDLSHVFEEGMPVWFTHPRFYHNEVDSLEKGDISYLNQLTMGEHCGTHVDAQAHFIKGGATIIDMPLNQLIGRGVVIDISHLPKNGLATKELIVNWEKDNGGIQSGDIVIFYTGHEHFWAVKPHYDEFMKDWRGLSRDGAEYLKSLKVKAVGTDAMSLEAFVNDNNPSHDVLLGANIPIIENLANLQKITKPFLFMALPLKIKNGSASPLRAIAVI